MKLDIKKLKKVHEDEHCTILQHDKGHSITVAHKALDKSARKQLAEIPHYSSGGYIEDRDKMHEADKSFKGRADPVMPKATGVSTPNPNPISYDEALKRLNAKPTGYADGGTVEDNGFFKNISDAVMPVVNDAVSYGKDILHSPGQFLTSGTTQAETQQAAQAQQASEAPPTNIAVPSSQPQVNPLMAPTMAQTSALQGAMGMQQTGMRNEAAAIGQQGQAEAQAAQQQQAASQKLQADYQQHFDSLTKERAAIISDWDSGHIDPNHFMSSKSDLGKVSTAIGLILSGIGAGVLHQDNAALKFLNAQIDRDVEGQKTDIANRNSKKQNMLSALQQQFGNLQDATNMARVVQADVYAAKLKETAAKASDPLAKARLMQAAGQLQERFAPVLGQLAQRKAILQGVSSGQVNPGMAVKVLVPEGQQPEAYKELDRVQTIGRTMNNLKNNMNEVHNLYSAGEQLKNPIQANSRIDALNTSIDASTRDLFGKVSDNEIHIIQGNKIGRMDDLATVQRKIGIINNLLEKNAHSSLLDAHGIKPQMPTQGFTKRPIR